MFAKQTDKVSSPFTPHSSLKHENPSPSIPLPRRGKKTAFTLTETLITLGIIGIVAALTIPNVVNNYVERKNIAKLKKVYSQLTIVYNQARDEKGPIQDYIAPYPGMYDEASHMAFRDYFASYFKILRKGKYTASWDGSVVWDCNSYSTFVANDGTSYIFRHLPDNCTGNFGAYADRIPICGELFVDLYSGKSEAWGSSVNKRTIGKNVFMFHVTKDKIVPAGLPTTGDAVLACYTNMPVHNGFY